MEKVVSVSCSASDICDVQALGILLSYLPEGVRDKIWHRMLHALALFDRERHVEVVKVVKNVLSICKNIAPKLPHVIRGKAIREAYNAAEATPTSTFLSIQLFVRFVESAPFYQTATIRANACKQLQVNIENNQDWNCAKAYGNGCGTYYRFCKSSKKYFFKVIDDIPVSVIYVLCVMLEADLLSDLVPFFCRLQCQGEVSRLHKVLFFILKGVWPFANRDLFFEGYGVDDLEENQRFWMVARSLDETREELPRGVKPPPQMEGSIRCEVYGGFRLNITSPTTTRVSFIVSVDPKIPVIPQTMINWVSGKIMKQILVGMTKATTLAQDQQGKYFDRRCKRPDTYRMLREHFNQAIKKMDPMGYEQYAIPEDY